MCVCKKKRKEGVKEEELNYLNKITPVFLFVIYSNLFLSYTHISYLFAISGILIYINT